jgi:DNA-directed RNA polymerase specialized sigma24 family protein
MQSIQLVENPLEVALNWILYDGVGTDAARDLSSVILGLTDEQDAVFEFQNLRGLNDKHMALALSLMVARARDWYHTDAWKEAVRLVSEV